MLIKGPKYSLELEDRYVKRMHAFMERNLVSLPSRISKILISEYATRRVLPPGSPRSGPWDNKITQYLVEPMDNLSPMSPVQREIVLKAAQGGWTALAENMICYYIDETPSDILLMSAGDDVIERWATRRLEPALDSFNIRKKLRVTHDANTKSKRTGDKMYSKDFLGGRLDMISARSASKMRATDKRILIRDEIDGVPAKLSTGEGYWLDVSYVRTNAWGARRKVYDLGTPTTYDKSEIWKAYLEGDQRHFMVPCPYCGAFQYLEFGSESSKHGIKPIYTAGQLESAVYVCSHCGEPIKNARKMDMVAAGYWEPFTKPSEKFWRSRYWPSYYSPFLSWTEIYSVYQRAKEKPDGMRSFINLYDGKPYKETGTRLSHRKIIALRSTYSSGTIPDGVLFTTIGVDVQKGSNKDPNNPPRIELEVCGHGKDYRTWSINYVVIEGAVTDAYSGAWKELFDRIAQGDFTYKDRLDREFKPVRIFIDSGWMSHVTYQFVQRVRGAYAVKGEGNNYKPDETIDVRRQSHDRRYKISKNVNETILYIIATNEYKRIMRAALQIQRNITGSEQPPSFCEFPSDYSEKYFKMLNAEEMLADGSFDSGGRRNEATDCRVYNLCAAESYLNDSVKSIRLMYRQQGYSEREVKALTKEHILMKLEKDLVDKLKTNVV